MTVARALRASQGQARWSGAKALDSPSPVLPYTGADFCHGEASVARIYPHLPELEPSAPFRAAHPNHVRRVLESHPTAFWRGQGLNPHKEPGRALMSW